MTHAGIEYRIGFLPRELRLGYERALRVERTADRPAGAVDYLTTPVDPAVLVRAVGNAIEVDRFRRTERSRLAELVRRYRLLTAREREIFPLLTAGLLNKQVASAMGISLVTVQIHRGRIMQKMEARTFAELVRFADALGISGDLTANAHSDWQRNGVPNGPIIHGARSQRVHANGSTSRRML